MPAAASTCWRTRWPISRGRSHFVDAFLCLVAVGVLFGMARVYTGNIAASIGLHAGWVAVIYVVKETSKREMDSPLRWMLSEADGFIGWMVLAWTCVHRRQCCTSGTGIGRNEPIPAALRCYIRRGYDRQQGVEPLDRIVELEQRLLVGKLDGQELGEPRANPARHRRISSRRVRSVRRGLRARAAPSSPGARTARAAPARGSAGSQEISPMLSPSLARHTRCTRNLRSPTQLMPEQSIVQRVEIGDARRAADGGGGGHVARFVAFLDEHHAERLLLAHAAPDHVGVAGFEDAQRQRTAGKQHGVQRKQRDDAAALSHPGSHSGQGLE